MLDYLIPTITVKKVGIAIAFENSDQEILSSENIVVRFSQIAYENTRQYGLCE